MTGEIIEKGDGTLMVKYTATSPHEAMIMAECCMAKSENVNLQTSTWGGRVEISLGTMNVPAIATMQPSPITPGPATKK